WMAFCSGAYEIRETPENAAAMNTPFAAAMPRQAPEALRHPLDIDARAMRKKSTPGISSAKKWAAATARNCSISPLDGGQSTCQASGAPDPSSCTFLLHSL